MMVAFIIVFMFLVLLFKVHCAAAEHYLAASAKKKALTGYDAHRASYNAHKTKMMEQEIYGESWTECKCEVCEPRPVVLKAPPGVILSPKYHKNNAYKNRTDGSRTGKLPRKKVINGYAFHIPASVPEEVYAGFMTTDYSGRGGIAQIEFRWTDVRTGRQMAVKVPGIKEDNIVIKSHNGREVTVEKLSKYYRPDPVRAREGMARKLNEYIIEVTGWGSSPIAVEFVEDIRRNGHHMERYIIHYNGDIYNWAYCCSRDYTASVAWNSHLDRTQPLDAY